MKAYKSMLIAHIPHSVVEKKIYGGNTYWAIVKGGPVNNEIIHRFDGRNEAVAMLMNLYELAA